MVQRSLLPKKATCEELNSLFDRATDLTRTAVDYKFILVLLFLKRVNGTQPSQRALMTGVVFIVSRTENQ
jgi:hypothetical protein